MQFNQPIWPASVPGIAQQIDQCLFDLITIAERNDRLSIRKCRPKNRPKKFKSTSATATSRCASSARA